MRASYDVGKVFDAAASHFRGQGTDNVPAGVGVFQVRGADLHRRGIQALLVEGGARTLQSFIDMGLWDEARIETNPSITIGDGVPAPGLPEARLAHAVTVDGNLLEVWENSMRR